MRRLAKTAAVGLAGVTLGVGGTLGVQALTDDPGANDYRTRAIWLAAFRECMRDYRAAEERAEERFGRGAPLDPQVCRRIADDEAAGIHIELGPAPRR